MFLVRREWNEDLLWYVTQARHCGVLTQPKGATQNRNRKGLTCLIYYVPVASIINLIMIYAPFVLRCVDRSMTKQKFAEPHNNLWFSI